MQFLQILKFRKYPFLNSILDKETIKKSRMFTRDYDGAINEIPQKKVQLTFNEASVIFNDYNTAGDQKVLIPNADNVKRFEDLASKSYNEGSSSYMSSKRPSSKQSK